MDTLLCTQYKESHCKYYETLHLCSKLTWLSRRRWVWTFTYNKNVLTALMELGTLSIWDLRCPLMLLLYNGCGYLLNSEKRILHTNCVVGNRQKTLELMQKKLKEWLCGFLLFGVTFVWAAWESETESESGRKQRVGNPAKVLDKLKFWPDDLAWWKVKGSLKLLQFILRGTWMSAPNEHDNPSNSCRDISLATMLQWR